MLNKYSSKYKALLKKDSCGIFSVFCDVCQGSGARTFANGDTETCYSCKGKGYYSTEGLVCANCLLDGCVYCGQLGYFDIGYSESSDKEAIRLV